MQLVDLVAGGAGAIEDVHARVGDLVVDARIRAAIVQVAVAAGSGVQQVDQVLESPET